MGVFQMPNMTPSMPGSGLEAPSSPQEVCEVETATDEETELEQVKDFDLTAE